MPAPSNPASGAAEKGKVTVDDASFMVVEFDNGALGSFEASRFASGRKNYNYFEIYGSKGSLIFDLERMNELEFLNLEDPVDEQGFRTILVTNATHPYVGAWWPPGSHHRLRTRVHPRGGGLPDRPRKRHHHHAQPAGRREGYAGPGSRHHFGQDRPQDDGGGRKVIDCRDELLL